MELLILAAVVIAAFGAITLGWVLAQGESRSAAATAEAEAEANQASSETSDASADHTSPTAEAPTFDHPTSDQVDRVDRVDRPDRAAYEAAFPRRNGKVPVEPPMSDRVVEADRFDPVTPSSLFVEQRRTDLVLPVNALQLNATDLIATQIERLQAEYVQLEAERERLAQELLTSFLIEKIEGSAGRLQTETKKEAQDLRQKLVKVSADFERAQFRLASLEHLQDRLDDPRVARQIDELVKFVKQLARER